jgi:uncharacterized protein (UPF0333 family)
MAVQGLDAAFAAIIKDCQAIAVEAVKNAAKKTQKDILKEADNYLQRYYSNYTPKRYKRTRQLQNAIKPVIEDHSTGASTSIEVGVEYDSSALKGAYRSNSRWHQSGGAWKSVVDYTDFSSDNGIPEPEWIMGNFLEGIHPWAQTDGESTNSLMEEFFDVQLAGRIEKYVQEELFAAITSRL